MANLSAEQQMQQATSLMQKLLLDSNVQLSDMRTYIKGLSIADTSGDGVISSKELSASMLSRGGVFPEATVAAFRKAGCTVGNQNEVARSAEVAGFTAIRRLHVLNNPHDVTYGNDVILSETIKRVARTMGMEPVQLDPAVKEFIATGSQAWGTRFNEQMIAVHKDMVEKGEIGQLPRQVLPMAANDLCLAMNGRDV